MHLKPPSLDNRWSMQWFTHIEHGRGFQGSGKILRDTWPDQGSNEGRGTHTGAWNMTMIQGVSTRLMLFVMSSMNQLYCGVPGPNST